MSAPQPVQTRAWWKHLDKAATITGFVVALGTAGCPMPGIPRSRMEPTARPSIQPASQPVEAHMILGDRAATPVQVTPTPAEPK